MERLSRGVVALPLGSGNFVSWRLFGTDSEYSTTFDVIRDGETVATGLTKTNYRDTKGTRGATYQIVTRVNGEAVETSQPVTAWAQQYLTLKLDRPAAGKTKPYTTTIDKQTVSFPDGQDYTYTPNDCSVGDVDGDGDYELIVKWDPSNSKDNSQNGVTGIVYIDCYKIAYGETSVSPVSGNELQNCRLLWRIDLGQNIRAGAHYTQFMVYDFDGDGRAEMMCKTAPGSKDGQGNYVNQAATDNRIKAASNTKDWTSEGAGRVNGGHEYLTVFNGETGAAIHTIAYYPNRNATTTLSEAAGTFNWGGSGKTDKGDYGNRGERYLAAVAYLGGPDANPSGIFCRGYYTYAFVWAVDFDGQQLKHRWLHRSDSQTQYSIVNANMSQSAKITAPSTTLGSGNKTLYGNGNHNMTVADVDGDGCDEIIWGSAALLADPCLDLLLCIGHVRFPHQDGAHFLQPFQGIQFIQDLLPVLLLRQHVRCQQVRRFADLLNRAYSVRRFLTHALGRPREFGEQILAGAQQRPGFRGPRNPVLAYPDHSAHAGIVTQRLLNDAAGLAFHEYADIFSRQVHNLADLRDGTDLAQVLPARIFDIFILLAYQKNLLPVRHSAFQGHNRFMASHIKVEHHIRKDHQSPQRQDRQMNSLQFSHVFLVCMLRIIS